MIPLKFSYSSVPPVDVSALDIGKLSNLASRHFLPILSISLSILISANLPTKAAETDLLRLPSLETTPPSPQPSNVRSADGPQSIDQLQNSRSSGNTYQNSGYQTGESYLLGAGDTVRVDVFRLPNYSGEYEVLINGILNLPMIGQVNVSGLTIEQAEQTVSQAYSSRLRRPIIDIFLVEPRPLRVGIAGEVSRPGEYVLQREGTLFPSLVEALETAGGITQSADLRQVVIQRPNVTGQQTTIVADLWQFLNTGATLQYSP